MGINDQGHLIISFVDGNVIDAGYVRGPQGIPGPSGQNAPQIDDTQASADHPWSGQKVRQELDALTAADVGARPDTWMPDGLIYETTAQALDAMSQEQQAALYAQGYRAIVATYNETVTMHALAADGSLAWIGCNQDPTNLLDNPDFAVAQAGYGGYHGSMIYAADRWGQNDSTVRTYEKVTRNGHGALKCNAATRIQQKLFLVDGQAYTGSFYINDKLCLHTFTANGGSYGNNEILINYQSDGTYMFVITNIPDGGVVSEPVLYPGSYTAKTLPPYVPKGYAAELAECLRYYQAVSSDSWTTCARPLGSSEFLVNLSAASPMRTVPQIAGKFKLFLENGWNEELVPVSIALTVCGYTTKIDTQVDAEVGKAYIVAGAYELIADL